MNDPPVTKIARCSFDEARLLIAQLRGFDLRAASIDDLKVVLNRLLGGYQSQATFFDPGLKLFRATKRTVNAIRDLSYPPPQLITKPQRANGEGCSKFYCSNFKNTIYFEIDAQPGDVITVSHWRTTGQLLVNPLGYSSAVFARLSSTREPPPYANVDFIVDEQNSLIQEFCREEFTRVVADGNDHEYRLAAAIAEIHSVGTRLHGIMYPTMAQFANAENFAVNPSFADEQIKFLYAERMRVDSQEGSSFHVTAIDTARANADESLRWSGMKPEWKVSGDYVARAEGGAWTICDKDGNEILPHVDVRPNDVQPN